MVVGPAGDGGQSQSGLAGQLESFGGLGTLAGLNLSDNSTKPFQVYLHLFTTPDLVQVIQSRQPFMQSLFAGAWDSKQREWRKPSGVGAALRRLVSWLLNRPGWSPPNAVTTSEYLAESLQITPIRSTGLYEISVSGANPAEGVFILETLSHGADEFLRKEALTRQSAYLDYLYKRLEQTNMLETQRAMSELILQGEKELMLAQTDLPFAGDVIVNPYVRSRPLGLSPVLVLFIAIIAGLGIGYVLFRLGWDSRIEHAVRQFVLR